MYFFYGACLYMIHSLPRNVPQIQVSVNPYGFSDLCFVICQKGLIYSNTTWDFFCIVHRSGFHFHIFWRMISFLQFVIEARLNETD